MMRRLAWCGIITATSSPVSPLRVQQVAADFVHLADGVLEDLLAVLVDVVQALVARSRARRACGCRRRASSESSPPEPSISPRKSMKPRSVVVLGRFQQHGAGAVAEQHAGGAVGVVDDAASWCRRRSPAPSGACPPPPGARPWSGRTRSRSRPRSGRSPTRPCAPMPFCTRQAVEGNIMSGVTVQTMMASRSRWPRCRAAASAHRRRLDRHVGGGHLGRGDVALANARALQNPLVVGLDHLFQVLIGQHARRRVATERADFGS